MNFRDARDSFFLGLSMIALTTGASAQHSHGQQDGHSHGEEAGHSHGDDHGHDHAEPHEHQASEVVDHGNHDDGHEDHGAGMSMAQLSLNALSAPVAGEPVTVSLTLKDENGTEITAADLAANHDHKLHVMIVDEGLDHYTHTHPEADENGRYQVSFTPEFGRSYRVWTDFIVADGHHDEPEGHHHDAPTGTPYLAAASLKVGEDKAPAVEAKNVLFADAGELRFRLWPESDVKAGEPVRMRLSVTDAEGTPFRGLEPIMGAYAHLVGFDQGATTMAHAHPTGAHPHGADSRGGPDLAFDVTLDKPGPHRLFLQTMKDGEEIGATFTVIAQP